MPALPPIGPYRGNPRLDLGYDLQNPVNYDITPGSVLDKLSKSFRNLGRQLFGENETSRLNTALVRNLQSPVSAASATFRNIYGTVDQQLETYGAFEANYRRAITEELRAGVAISPARRRALQAASKSTGQIDLSLISSLQERTRLVDELTTNVFKMQTMVEQLGFPGVYLPSANPFRATARMVTTTEAGYEPMLDLMQQATFTVDPLAESGAYTDPLSTLRVGTRALPSLSELQARVARGGHASLKDLPSTARLFFADIETTGVSDIDLARSISVGTGSLKDVAGVRTVEIDRGVDLGARFNTAQMSGYVSADPYDLRRVTGLGTAVIEKETRFGSAPRGLADRIYDLTTEAGRSQAKGYYSDLFSQLSADDAFLVAYNGQFDVRGMATSARSLGVDEEIITRFEERMGNGGLVDVLGTVREKLNNKLAKRLETSMGTPEQKAILGLQSLLSDSALQQARVAGEAVKPFGLENVLQSTNFLELLGKEVEGGSAEATELLDLLSSSQASHVDFTDRKVAEKVLEYTDRDELDFIQGVGLPGLTESTFQKIASARLNVASSRAIVATTNLADPRYLTQAAYENIIGTDAIQRIEMDTPMSAIIAGSTDESARLKFDPNTGSFRLFTPDPTNPVGPSIATDLPTGFNPQAFIRENIDRIRGLSIDSPLPMGQPTFQTLGISPIQMTNIHSTNQMLSARRAPLIDAIGSNIAANEEALIQGLVSTRQIGFNPLPETAGFGGDVTRLMRGTHDPVTEVAQIAYRDAVYNAGISGASMNADVRSTFVGLSKVTSPLIKENKSLLRQVAETAGVSTGPVSEAQIAGRVESLSGQLGSNARYLGELGAVTARTQKQIVAGETVSLLPKTILEKSKTLDDSGNVVGFLSEQAMGSRGNALRLSTLSRETEGLTVNFIYGGRLSAGYSTRRAVVEAKSMYMATVDHLASLSRSPEAMIEAGLATTREQANQVLSAFKPLNEAGGVEAYKVFSRSYKRAGVGVATLGESDKARQVQSLIQGLAGSADTDTLAAQKGLVVSLGDINEEFSTFFPRLSNEAVSEATRVGGAGIDLVTRASATKQRELFKSVLRRGVDDPEFFGRIRGAFSAARADSGVGGTSLFADRLARNQHLIDKVAKIKPGVYKGLGAVAALSAGYYLGKRSQKEDLYEEVMQQQPTEANIGPMAIADFNALDQQIASQSSSRRDPLVTAGVVGNLDRNKISHTRMGSDKYNHLFGA
jgi:hypothetical protein